MLSCHTTRGRTSRRSAGAGGGGAGARLGAGAGAGAGAGTGEDAAWAELAPTGPFSIAASGTRAATTPSRVTHAQGGRPRRRTGRRATDAAQAGQQARASRRPR